MCVGRPACPHIIVYIHTYIIPLRLQQTMRLKERLTLNLTLGFRPNDLPKLGFLSDLEVFREGLQLRSFLIYMLNYLFGLRVNP